MAVVQGGALAGLGGGGVEQVGGAPAGGDQHRSAIGQGEQPGAGGDRAAADVSGAAVEPDQVSGGGVQQPQPAAVIDGGGGRVDLGGQRDQPAPGGQGVRVGGGQHAAAGVQAVRSTA